LLGTLKRLERPDLQEGYDVLYAVQARQDGSFDIGEVFAETN
jgi:hypothetical protein